MKKQNIINLVKYYVDKNDSAFRAEVAEIAADFGEHGEEDIGNYLLDLISTTDFYVPQNNYRDLQYLKKNAFTNKPLLLPDEIRDDVLGIVRASNSDIRISKVLFYGVPGTGKTQSAYQIARLLDRDLLSVRMEDLVDSHLGQTPKNIVRLFDEIRHLPSQNVVVLFDELDSLVMNRINDKDLREMGRVTSTFLKELDTLSDQIMIIATTNLIDSFDKALLRRFDGLVSFDRYSKDDLIDIANSILQQLLKKSKTSKSDMRLFNKILRNMDKIPYPGEMFQIIKVSLAFADDSNEYDYLRRLYMELTHDTDISIKRLSEEGYTTREIEVITRVSKSSVSRKIREI
ncbi:ATP-binding protein [Butyrivibrio sp. AE3006]|uniref:ATP-binding protein n=1 Tax=Butyrivibrio sp. AE3006 TaxID=1280673 RepID=UPI00040D067E|nr:ATP-binding protein [Butyrivibrio sp. AE3006]